MILQSFLLFLTQFLPHIQTTNIIYPHRHIRISARSIECPNSKCSKRIAASLDLSNIGTSNTAEQIVVIDAVYDPILDRKLQLLHPFIVILKQKPVFELYELTRVGDVNGEATEEVINKRNPRFRGCDGSTIKGNCGKVIKGGKMLPYSQGFCCSCSRNASSKWSKRQKRGGQECLNPYSYHSSAHCLRFSDLWYSVNELEKPTINHMIHAKVYQKRETEKAPYWVDITTGHTAFIGTTKPGYKTDTLRLKYRENNPNPQFTLNHLTKNILIPKNPSLDHPNIRNTPNEYLIVNKHQVDINGKHCNVPGVNYPAFNRQFHRCDKKPGSCLHNQPVHLWKRDENAKNNGYKGEYMLENFAKVRRDALTTNEKGNLQLVLPYEMGYENNLDVFVRNSMNGELNNQSKAKVTEVYTDATDPHETLVITKIYNSGFTCANLRARLSSCPLDVSSDWNKITPPQRIFPQQTASFHFLFKIPVPKQMFCTVSAVGEDNRVLAIRKISFKKRDICLCMFHCNCACASEGLKCKPMNEKVYQASGFAGPRPIESHSVKFTKKSTAQLGVFTFVIILSITLMILGLTKGLIGLCCCEQLGLMGLDLLVSLPRNMYHYLEPTLKHRLVIYDDSGWPIHPDTYIRVRNINRVLELSLNLAFFFTFPPLLVASIMRNLFYSIFKSFSKPPRKDNTCYYSSDECSYHKPQKISKSDNEHNVCLLNSDSSNFEQKQPKTIYIKPEDSVESDENYYGDFSFNDSSTTSYSSSVQSNKTCK